MRNLLIGLLFGASAAVAQSRIEMGSASTAQTRPPAYKMKVTKSDTTALLTDESGKHTIAIARRDLVAPKIITQNWMMAPGGYIYTYTVENGAAAKQPISSKAGPIAPGKTGVVSFYSTFPPGPTKVRFGAPVDLKAELARPSIPNDIEPEFLDAVGKFARSNYVEVDGIGPVEPADATDEP